MSIKIYKQSKFTMVSEKINFMAVFFWPIIHDNSSRFTTEVGGGGSVPWWVEIKANAISMNKHKNLQLLVIIRLTNIC